MAEHSGRHAIYQRSKPRRNETKSRPSQDAGHRSWPLGSVLCTLPNREPHSEGTADSVPTTWPVNFRCQGHRGQRGCSRLKDTEQTKTAKCNLRV